MHAYTKGQLYRFLYVVPVADSKGSGSEGGPPIGLIIFSVSRPFSYKMRI